MIQPENSGHSGGLKPFQKGVSGNPGGRPSHATIRAALKPYEQETVERLITLMRSASKDSTSLEAVKTILAYLHGSPNSVQVGDLSTDELLAILVRRKEQESQARQ